jgi:AcrR family transcriptional regulator
MLIFDFFKKDYCNMPPKFKFTKQEIIEAALNLIRRKGWNTLSTRTLANELGSSARPIYSFFKSMDELDKELVKESVNLLYKYMVCERTGDAWIDHGIGYVIFAQEEKNLFIGSNNEKNIKYQKEYGEKIWNTLTESLSDYPLFQGLSGEQIYKIQTLRWLLAHGLAFQVSNPPPDVWNDENIVMIIQQGSMAILDGLKKQFISKEE